MKDKVLIVGSGVAALAAALAAQKSGQEVTLVVSRPGASALMSGTWDVARDPHRHATDAWEDLRPARKILPLIIRQQKNHPYSILQQSMAIEDVGVFLEKAIVEFAQAIHLPLVGSLDESHVAPSGWGTVKETSFVPKGLAGGNVLKMNHAHLLVVGLGASLNFDADFIMQSLRGYKNNNYFSEIKTAQLNFKKSDFSSIFDMARWLEEEEGENQILEGLQGLVKTHQPTHILLPPVLGLEGHQRLYDKISEVTHCVCFESLATPPSVHGWRLQYLIAQAVEAHKISMVHGVVKGFKREGRLLRVALMENGQETMGVPFDLCILATGRFMCQGLEKRGSFFQEPLCHLPLFDGEQWVTKTFSGKLTRKAYFDSHPLFSVGLRVNSDMRPLDDKGDLCYDNLWVAGSIIGGYATAWSGCGMGVAIGTGKLAGETRGQ
ncbi:MAG: hypothetical protein A3I75_06240 [Deltaproteobacteria bacterium RIFCSPLOWO2_02_FULL_50_16]|nr:MAG: hypothetical protein A3B79_01120 [Deltaproteobacteria bacterium RIFCSPHIGHO2_02_FULL_50_15]OGQ56543.1 MAG: hypothetical protein A3I75_06240 [Deltaproteobacteria bacterium RIFCSPLOWO2_02_FULL_50_16]OGQ65892.1 MAG: hypothetical protein A3F89_02570 [Deltaproteobacteria bacterium RIFCSPLOWO2_12_FULL_50_11]